MKITRRQLRGIIREEMSRLNESDEIFFTDIASFAPPEVYSATFGAVSRARDKICKIKSPDTGAKHVLKDLHSQGYVVVKAEQMNEADSYPRITGPGSGVRRPAGAKGPLGNLAEDILDTIDNAVGQVDLDFGDSPMTRKDVIDFVMRLLAEE